MNRHRSIRSLPALLVLAAPAFARASAAQEPSAQDPAAPAQREPAPAIEKRGVVSRTDAAFPGLNLLAPLHSTSTYLVDLDGAIVHEWKSDAPPGQSVYLRENGHLLRAERVDNDVFYGGGEGGRVRELALDGTVVWEYVCSDATRRQHHDFTMLPNGHLLLIAWERKSGEQAFEAGRDPSLLAAGELWPDMLLEVELTPPSGGKVVWEWHAWDHLVQERAPTKPNYGKVAEHPELVDVNADRQPRSEAEDAAELEDLRRLGYAGDAPRSGDARRGRGGPSRGGDWLHTNAVDYEPKLDLIALSVHSLSEVWILDHSTTTAQAASHAGGRYGRGGDLLARFGNPRVHGRGAAKDQFLFGQHNVQWIAAGLPGAGHLLVFDNGQGSASGASSVDEYALDLGVESVARGLPTPQRVWTYEHPNIDSGHISGAQRLANGNTLICAGETGRLVEVTPKGEVAWDFLSTLRGD
ncbi:MAG: aryl-sulfate sulfotransferase, partial [Planctomycetes bacterium]|nr:aryl-sulfate sulfotransferase [Planctomycetota bacterium]